jgi:hypothetical protein
MNRNGNRQLAVLLLLLAFTGQSLAALLAPCLLPDMQQQETAMVMAPAPLPAVQETGHHHDMAGHMMVAAESAGMRMDMPMHHAMTTGNTAGDVTTPGTSHLDHNCCHGLCACIAMGNFSQAATTNLELALAQREQVLPASPAEQVSAPFLSPSLRPPISLA